MKLLFILVFVTCVFNLENGILFKVIDGNITNSIDVAPSFNNKIGSRKGSCILRVNPKNENTSKVYLFGGFGFSYSLNSSDFIVSEGYLNDLWEYSEENSEWTFISGSNLTNDKGNYSIDYKNEYGPNFIPSSRSYMSCFTGKNSLIIFAGMGNESLLNDVWEFNNEEWRIKKFFSSQGHIEIQDLHDSQNQPSPQYGKSVSKISEEHVLFFGGIDENGEITNELWDYYLKYNIWRNVIPNQNASYPAKKSEYNKKNQPNKRYFSSSWFLDSFYIFGGKGKNNSYFNDFWSFNVEKEEWSFLSGSNESNIETQMKSGEIGFYPSSRSEAHVITFDESGYIFLLFGENVDGLLNEIFLYSINDNLWNFLNLNSSKSSNGSYIDELPFERTSSVCIKGENNKILFFTGELNYGLTNDAWEFFYCAEHGDISTNNGTCICEATHEGQFCETLKDGIFEEVYDFFELLWKYVYDNPLLSIFGAVASGAVVLGFLGIGREGTTKGLLTKEEIKEKKKELKEEKEKKKQEKKEEKEKKKQEKKEEKERKKQEKKDKKKKKKGGDDDVEEGGGPPPPPPPDFGGGGDGGVPPPPPPDFGGGGGPPPPPPMMDEDEDEDSGESEYEEVEVEVEVEESASEEEDDGEGEVEYEEVEEGEEGEGEVEYEEVEEEYEEEEEEDDGADAGDLLAQIRARKKKMNSAPKVNRAPAPKPMSMFEEMQMKRNALKKTSFEPKKFTPPPKKLTMFEEMKLKRQSLRSNKKSPAGDGKKTIEM